CFLQEGRGDKVAGRADARRRKCYQIGIFLEVRNQIGRGIDRKIWIGDQHIRRAHQQRQEVEVLERLVFQVLVQNRVNGIDADRSNQQRVTVGRNRFHSGGPNAAV